MTEPESLLHLARDARGVATLTLNDPARFNALGSEMLAALQQTLTELAQDDALRVVVLAGAGKAFCAGHNLKDMAQHPELSWYQQLFAACSRVMLGITQLPVPVIARVHGVATAAGCQLVAACDLAVAANTARFAVSGVNLGLFCSTPAVALSRNMGRKQAFEMLVTGEFISADEARARGLLNRVAAPHELDAELERLVASIVAKPRTAVAMGKELYYRQLEMGVAAAYQTAVQTMACNMMDADALEGVQAFIDKRPPGWARPAG